MRADMAKVLVERPRYASGAPAKAKGYDRSLARERPEHLPHREGMKRRCRGGTKAFSEHLGPLKRFLHSQVGRPWDKVYAEISAQIDRGNIVQKHILTHLFDFVATRVVLLDGVPHNGEGRGYGQPLSSWAPFYVCPRTGILRRLKQESRKRRKPAEVVFRHVRLDDRQVCCWLAGTWHLVEVKKFPPDSDWLPKFQRVGGIYDPVWKRNLTVDQARAVYGAAVYGVSCRLLSRRELKQLPIPLAWQQ